MQDLHNVFEDKLKKQTILQTEMSRVRVIYTTLKKLKPYWKMESKIALPDKVPQRKNGLPG